MCTTKDSEQENWLRTFDGGQEIDVSLLVALAANEPSQAQRGGHDDIRVVEISVQLDLLSRRRK